MIVEQVCRTSVDRHPPGEDFTADGADEDSRSAHDPVPLFSSARSVTVDAMSHRSSAVSHPSSSTNAVLAITKLATTALAAALLYWRFGVHGSRFDAATLLIAPVLAVAVFDYLFDRQPNTTARDVVAAANAGGVVLLTMLVVVPWTVGGSGLRFGVEVGALVMLARPFTVAVARSVAKRTSNPLQVVALCSPREYRRLRQDIIGQRRSLGASVVAWSDVFPTTPAEFRQFWMIAAEKVWSPSRLVIVVSPSYMRNTEYVLLMSELEDLRARVCTIDAFYERFLGLTPVHPGESLLLLLDEHDGPRPYRVLKAVIDPLLAIVGLVMLVVVGPFIALAIKLTSRGPVLYRQERVGRYGRTFHLLKFRTMRVDAEPSGPRFADRNDPRVFPLGNFLRRTRLDELPQCWNVLRGEMSLVGPRPERPQFFEELDSILPAYRKRLLVRPGITGWAQINEPYAVEVDEHRRKLERDLYYIRHQSATLDLLCLGRTLSSILRLAGH